MKPTRILAFGLALAAFAPAAARATLVPRTVYSEEFGFYT